MILTKVPHELIRLALTDLEKTEQDPRYVINMGGWHAPQDDGRCAVCLAGSVMAQTLKTPINDLLEPHDDPSNGDQYRALNWFRSGEIKVAFILLGLKVPEGLEDFSATPYGKDPVKFKAEMLSLANRIEMALNVT